MPTATVHGQTDTVLLHNGNNEILCSPGRMYGTNLSTDGSVACMMCFTGSGGRLFYSSTLNYSGGDWGIAVGAAVAHMLDGEGNFYFATNSASGGYDNLIKLDISTQEYWKELWAVRVGPTTSTIGIHGLCIDNDGNILVSGGRTIAGYYTFSLLVKINPVNGAIIWEAPEMANFSFNQVAVDSDNNVYVASEGVDALRKYNSDGVFQWSWNALGEGDSGGDRGVAVAVSSTDVIFVGCSMPVKDAEAKCYYVHAVDVDGNLLRRFQHVPDETWRYQGTTVIEIDAEDNLYFNIKARFGTGWLYKTDLLFNVAWSQSFGTGDYPGGLTFTPGKRFFVHEVGGGSSMHQLRDDATGALIWSGLLYHEEGVVRAPAFAGPELWTGEIYDSPNYDRVPVRDSGCFIDPTYPPNSDWDPDLPPPIPLNQVFYRNDKDYWWLGPYSDNGLYQCLKSQQRNPLHFPMAGEAHFRRLCRCRPKPFEPHIIQGNTTDHYAVDVLVYHEGTYYRCILEHFSAIAAYAPPNATYWEAVAAPTLKWDSIPGFGGKGGLDPGAPEGTTPQIYTVVVCGVEDGASAAHSLNGIYYAKKRVGGTSDSRWGMWRNRPGEQSIRCTFTMVTHSSGEASYPKYSAIWLQLTWMHENTYDAGRTYHVGESIITHGASLVQKCYSCILEHSGEEPPNATYWEEQTPPWETWSSTYQYALNEYCLHKGEWYKALSSHNNHEPPNETYWTHITGNHDDYPSYKTVYQSSTCEDNYGFMPDWKGAANQDPSGCIGFSGLASVYPGAIYQWSPTKSYVEDDIVVWDGYFYKAKSAHSGEEPPNAAYWDLLGTSEA